MNLNIKSFTTLVTDQVTAIQAKSALLVDLTIGSLLRAIVESNSGVILWLQQLIVNLLVITRAATCSGSDLDTWLADYGFTREPATYATGPVTFSRFTATNAALITIGSQVTTNDGTQTYNVILDTGNANYNACAGWLCCCCWRGIGDCSSTGRHGWGCRQRISRHCDHCSRFHPWH
ncbi:baseplate J/gp47 family protein [Pantoea stewartii]|uniref:baseplate J/gp47 family protein n=1 Tax=Pantoea stewartii TaxID=66269 RepID=UPI003704AFFE